jgi:hypothetical protein
MRHRLACFLFSAVVVSLGCAGGGKGTTTGKGGAVVLQGLGGNGGGAAGAAGTTGEAGTTGLGGSVAGPAGSGPAGSSPTGGAGANPSGAAGTTGVAGATTSGDGGSTSTTMDAGADHLCQEGMFTFQPKIPTVYMLVDRSGSMFACVGNSDVRAPPCADHTMSYWNRLQGSILQVVQQLQADVRFGIATIGGTTATCPDIKKVAPALNNYDAINALYTSLPFRTDSDKWETPTRLTLDAIGAELTAITAPGDKYILLVTDGEPDYCNDGNALCPPDSVVGKIQALKAQPAPNSIGTIVFGLQSAVASLSPNTLAAFANAGAGEPTKAPFQGTTTDLNAFWDQCNNEPHWKADIVAKLPMCADAANFNACRGKTVGDYATTAGPTKPFTPDASSQSAIATQLKMALSSVKSCLFDLGDLNGQSIKVDLNQLDQANVVVMGAKVPHDDANGWKMNDQTQLELVGSACTNWKKPDVNTIDFQFPCSTIIFE